MEITKSSGGAAGNSRWAVAAELVRRQRWPFYVEHKADETFEAHYHAADEELHVLRGDMTFFETGRGDLTTDVHAGDAAAIPEGVVHRVVVGPRGVAYVMGLSRAYLPEGFSRCLPADENDAVEGVAELVEANYAISQAEEEADEKFFRKRLADEFVFVGATGDKPLTKSQFIEGLAERQKRQRRSSDLRLRREGGAILASLRVKTGDGAVYLNSRLFERRNGVWLCVRWTNARTFLTDPTLDDVE